MNDRDKPEVPKLPRDEAPRALAPESAGQCATASYSPRIALERRIDALVDDYLERVTQLRQIRREVGYLPENFAHLIERLYLTDLLHRG